MNELTETLAKDRMSFAIVIRGHPDDFAWLKKQVKAAGLYIVYTRTSYQKLVIEEVPW
jgi:hypothetical protein